MFNKINFSEVLPVENGIVFTSSDGIGLFFLRKEEKEAELITCFPSDLDGQWMPYKALEKAGNKIFLPPCLAEDIIVYDCESKNSQIIKLDKVSQKQNGLCKFWTSIACNEYVYFIGHYYPAIVKLNIYTMELSYLTEWVEKIEERRRLKEAPYLGIGIVQGDAAFFPCCCANVVLRLDLKTDETRIYEIHTDMRGFNGICFSEGKYWLPARDSYEVAIWNKDTNDVDTLELEGERNRRHVFFRPPLMLDKRLYLFPAAADHAYYIDTSDKTIRRIETVEKILSLEDSTNYSKIVSPPVLVDGKIYFVTGKDNVWHIYDPISESLVNFSVQIDTSGKKKIKRGWALKDFYKAISEKNEAFPFAEEELFSCREFCDFTNEYQSEIDTLMLQVKGLKKQAGQRIYNRLNRRT